STIEVISAAGLAAADVDGDGSIEVFAGRAADSRLLMLEYKDNTLYETLSDQRIWSHGGSTNNAPIVSIGNLDADNDAEVLVGFDVFDVFVDSESGVKSLVKKDQPDIPTNPSDPTVVTFHERASGFLGPSFPAIAEVAFGLPGSEGQEIILGGSVLTSSGHIVWDQTYLGAVTQGPPAVADINGDGDAEIVFVSGGQSNSFVIAVKASSGDLVWHTQIPDIEPTIPNTPGPPVVADLDGDGNVEIALADRSVFAVFDGINGEVKWTLPVDGSGVIGASAFDFDADGRTELVYGDDHNLYILSAPIDPYKDQLDVRWAFARDHSTNAEAPVVADVDADGDAEIVFSAYGWSVGHSADSDGLNGGIYIADEPSWSNTRPIWNQDTYHVTNINDDLTVPSIESPSWLTHNTYRENAFLGSNQTEGVSPDLIASYVRVSEYAGNGRYTVRIGNAGSRAVEPGVKVAFFAHDPATGAFDRSAVGQQLGVVETTTTLGHGQFEDVTFETEGLLVPEDHLWIVADWDAEGLDAPVPISVYGYINECNEANNTYHLADGLVSLPANFDPTIESLPVTRGVVGDRYVYDAIATDINVDQTHVFAILTGPEGMVIDGAAGLISWVPTGDQIGSHDVSLLVEDGFGGRDIQQFSVTVTAPNAKPIVTLPPIGVAVAGSEWQLTLDATDPNGDELTYSFLKAPIYGLPGTDPTIDTDGVVRWTPPSQLNNTAHQFVVAVDDGRGGITTAEFWVTVGRHASPQITSTPTEIDLFVGHGWDYQVIASDAEDGGNLDYSLDVSTAALGVGISSGGLVNWTPDAEGTYTIRVKVADQGKGPEFGGDVTSPPALTTQTFQVTVREPSSEAEGLLAPVIQNEIAAPAVPGRAWSYAVEAASLNEESTGLVYSFPVSSGPGAPPSGVTIDGSSGQVAWDNPVAGYHVFTIQVAEASDPTAYTEKNVTLPVITANPPVIIGAPTRIQSVFGSARNVTFQVQDFEGQALTLESLDPDVAVFTQTALPSGPAGPQDVTLTIDPGSFDSDQPIRTASFIVRDSDGNESLHTVFVDLLPSGVQASLTVTGPAEIALGETWVGRFRYVDADPQSGTPTFGSFSNPNVDGRVVFEQGVNEGWVSWTPPASFLQKSPLNPNDLHSEKTLITGLFVSDDGSTLFTPLTVKVTASRGGNRLPTINSSSVGSAASYDEPLVYAPRATDPDGDALTWSILEGPDTASIDPISGLFVWHPSDDELTRVQTATIEVRDPYGGTDTEIIELKTSPQLKRNLAPRIEPASGLRASKDGTWTFDVPATDPNGDDLSFSFVDAASLSTNGTADIDPNTGKVTWTPNAAANAGSVFSFTVRAEEVRGNGQPGAYAVRTFDVFLVEGSIPTVELQVDRSFPQPGQRVFFTVVADDEVGIVSTELILKDANDVQIARLLPDAQGVASYVFEGAVGAIFTATAVAVNVDGNEEEETKIVRLSEADTSVPRASIKNIRTGQVLSEAIDVRVSVTDPGPGQLPLKRVTLALESVADDRVIPLFDGQDVPQDDDWAIASIDPLSRPDGAYRLVLTVTDQAGKTSQDAVDVRIESLNGVKVGNFNLGFTDITIPVAGVPITVQRTYDTLNAPESLDFGHGWSLDLITGHAEVTNLLESAWRDDTTGLFSGPAYGPTWRQGTEVTLTLPGGEKQSFRAIAVEPVTGNGPAGVAGGLVANSSIHAVAFMPAPGQDGSRLDFAASQERFKYPFYLQRELDGEIATDSFNSATVVYDEETGAFRRSGGSAAGSEFAQSFTPEGQGLDYRLTRPDGTKYIYDSSTLELLSVQDPDGNAVSFSDTSIVAKRGGQTIETLVIERDAQGRILEVYRDEELEAERESVRYGYDTEGNLAWVLDRSGRLTSMKYDELLPGTTAIELDHILTSIVQYPDRLPDPDATDAQIAADIAAGGSPVMQIGFDSDGRVSKIVDASGAQAGFEYTNTSSFGRGEVVTDDLGAVTEVIRDDRGNVVRQIQQISLGRYLVSHFDFDEDGNRTAAYEPFEAVSLAAAETAPKPSATLSTTKYDSEGRVSETVDALGNMTRFKDYHPTGSPRLIIGPLGNQTVNEYDKQGRLRSTIDSEGNKTEYVYNTQGNLRTIYRYDDANRRIESGTFSYDNHGRLIQTTEVDAGGDSGNQAPVTRYFAYDEEGNQTHAWHVWTDPQDSNSQKTLVNVTAYDEEGRSLSTAQHTLAGAYESSDGDAVRSALIGHTADWSAGTTYDNQGRVSQATDQFGRETHTRYDSRGNVVETRTQTETSESIGIDAWIVTRTFYDDNGRAVATTDPFLIDQNGDYLDPTDESNAVSDRSFLRLTHTIYDDAGRVVETRRIANSEITVAAVGSFYEAGWDDNTIDGDENTYAAGTKLSWSTTTYDGQGRVETTVSQITASNPDGVRTDYYYDPAGRQIGVLGPEVDLDGDPNTEVIRRTLSATHYDKAGRQLESITGIAIDAVGRPGFAAFFEEITGDPDGESYQQYRLRDTIAQEDASSSVRRRASFTHDKLGRVTHTTQHGDAQTGDLTAETVYDALGRRSAEIDPLRRRTDYHFDDAGRLTGVTLPGVIDADPNSNTFNQTVRPHYAYGYDAFGRQTEITDPQERTTTFGYDAQGRQTSRTLPLGQPEELGAGFTESSTYITSGIHDGLQETATDFEGNTVTFGYDDFGRQYLAVYTDANGVEQRRVEITYDALGRVKEIEDTGNQGLGTTTHTYDANGRLAVRATPVGTINYEYDDTTGRLDATHTESTRTEYGYDDLGRLTTVAVTERFNTTANLTAGGEITTYVYDALGQTDYEVGPNGVTKDHQYDALGRLTDIVHFTGDDGDGIYEPGPTESLVARFVYTYDAAGNRSSSTETIGALQQVFTYAYDGLNRLTKETLASSTDPSRDYTTEYRFDLSSNRTQLVKDAGSDGYTSTGGDETVDYTYDANDRLLAEDSTDDNNDKT
ncbi:MAG: putative Ig domain-containing protein, partial [Planctomycetota bacterium]